MFIDTHVHFWQLERGDPIGVNHRVAGLERDFAPADLKQLCEPLGVSRVVLVQAAPTVEESEYILDLAEQEPLVAAVVGWVDLAGDVPAQLRRVAGRAKLAGVRAMAADVRQAGWLVSAPVMRGIEAVAAAGFALDLLVRPWQVPDCIALMRAMPGLRANVNHCGRPLIVAREWKPWADHMAELAACSGVVCKLSGLIERGGFEWSVEDVQPYVDHLLKAFGSARLMYASNWPIINLVGNYPRWWEAANAALTAAGATDQDRSEIFAATARRFYRLDA